jgi:hypothetical protein
MIMSDFVWHREIYYLEPLIVLNKQSVCFANHRYNYKQLYDCFDDIFDDEYWQLIKRFHTMEHCLFVNDDELVEYLDVFGDNILHHYFFYLSS